MEKTEGGGIAGLAEAVRGYRDDFMTEIRSMLDEIDLFLIDLEAEPAAREPLGLMYRRFHAIGGLADLLQERTAARLSRETEDLIEVVRKYRTRAEPQVVNQLVHSARFLRRIATDATVPEDSRFAGEIGQHLAAMAQLRSDLMMEVRQSLEHETRIGQILIGEGAVAQAEVEAILDRQKAEASKMKFGEILLREKRLEASDVIRAIRMQKLRTATPPEQSVRIPLERMDELIRMVDEARLLGSNLQAEALLRFGSKDRFSNETTGMTERLEDMRRVLLALRMVPLSGVFGRLLRTIGSLLEETHRNVRLATVGETTEVDKELADNLFQPLADAANLMLLHTGDQDAEGGLGSIEVVAYRETEGLHIDLTGDGRADLAAIRSHESHERLQRTMARLGGRIQLDDMSGDGIRIRLLIPEREVGA